MYSKRQRALVQQVLEAARDGRFCYANGGFWVFVMRGAEDMVVQVNFAAATSARLNSRESWQVRRANPPHRDTKVVHELEGILAGYGGASFRTIL